MKNFKSAIMALLLLFAVSLPAYAVLDGAVCSASDPGGSSCTKAQLLTSINEEDQGIDDRAPMTLGSVAGTNTITASVTPTLTAYADPQSFYLKPANDITGAATLNIDTIGAKALVNASGSALSSGDLLATNYYIVKYVAASDHFRVLTNLGAGGFASSSGAFIMQANSGSFSAERALTAGTAITLTDGGANSTMTVGVTAGAIGTTQIGTDGVSADELNATGVESELEAVLDLPQLQGEVTASNIAADAVDSSEIAANAVGSSEIASNAVQQAEIDDDAVGIAELDLVDGDTPSNGDCLTYDTGSGGTIEAITCPGAGGGDSVTVNAAAVTDPDFDDATPAAAAGDINIKWQVSGSDVSGYVDNILGKHTIYVPAAGMTSETTTGCASGSTETSNGVMIPTKDCDGATQEGVQFVVGMPKSSDEGTLTFRVDWTAASGSGDVIWLLSCLARSNDDAIDTAFGTEVSVTDTVLTAVDLHSAPETAAVTPGGTWAQEDVLWCRLQRDGDAAGDTLNAVDAKVIGVRALYTVNALTDD